MTLLYIKGELFMKFLVDSFQLFMPCDESLTSWMHANDLNPVMNVRGRERSTIPIVYCDNTLSTIKKPTHLRKYAFEDNSKLTWNNRRNGIYIPSENFFIDIEDLGDTIKVTADTTSDYHLEFKYKLDTNMGLWENWFAIYLPVPTAMAIMKFLGAKVPKSQLKESLTHEVKQTTGKREDFYYLPVPVNAYQFTYESFQQAKSHLENQGFNGSYKGISFENRSPNLLPFMKTGYVHTKEEDGDFNRNPQIAIKLAQRKTNQHATRPRGDLKVLEDTSNHIIIDKKEFILSMVSVLGVLYKEVYGYDQIGKMQRAAST